MEILREHIINSLKGGQAYVPVEKAIKNVKPEFRRVQTSENLHSVWEELEHMRLAQEDLLYYMIDPEWKSPEWPNGYWPKTRVEVSDGVWEKTYNGFLNDINKVINLAANPKINLLEIIPHTKSHTYLRELLILIEHNAYHLGKIVDIRKALGDWRR